MAEQKKSHRYSPYEYHFDDLCDAGCARPVPSLSDSELRTKGWDIADDPTYVDGKRRVCAECVDKIEITNRGTRVDRHTRTEVRNATVTEDL